MSNYQFQNILVTGGAGFIGSNFVHYLQHAYSNCKIVNLDKLTYAGSMNNLTNLPAPDRHRFIQGDICDIQLVHEILNYEKIDTIVHFAAESHVDRSIASPNEFIQTNVFGTFNLLDSAKKFWIDKEKRSSSECRFHHVSTDEVYGSLSANDPPFTEKNPYAPNSPYAASKASSDHLVRAYYKTYGLPTTISNCSNNFGRFQHQEKLIPKVVNACLHQQPITIYGDGSQIRDWLYVEDHCSAIETILRHGNSGETYNVGGNNEKNNMEIVRLICSMMDDLRPRSEKYHHLIQLTADRPGHDWRYAIDSSKINQKLGWESTNNFEQHLLKTIQSQLNAMEENSEYTISS